MFVFSVLLKENVSRQRAVVDTRRVRARTLHAPRRVNNFDRQVGKSEQDFFFNNAVIIKLHNIVYDCKNCEK